MTDDPAYQEGYDAYWDDVDPDDNPYPSGIDEHWSWDRGWSQAQLEDGAADED